VTGPARGGGPAEGTGEWLAGVAAAPVGRLATGRADGGIDLVPFVFAWLPDPPPLGRLVSAVDHKPKRHQRLQRLANVAAHPEVTVLVDHYEDDWSALWWVRLRGRAAELAPGADADALSALVAKYRPYQDRPPGGPLLRIELTAVSGWSAR
jgi:PPOX class probable F420-dependent enzyme